METKTAPCPLGAECETAKDGAIYRCPWFVQVRGTNPNTGAEVDDWACAIAWTPILLIENSQQQRQTGAAVESFRNAMTEQNQVLLQSVENGDIKKLT